ncbi:multiple epidermal growth factor-like domains protein 10 [Saccostrea cucullata]|uniref:multiple epidermal growth factor-like domains protein 10 n=1 Tax=Saccostrea cuccullata TaxID=36930 RepID=UPI002ED24EC4
MKQEELFLCYKNGPELPPLDFTINCSKHGRYIKYYNERLPNIDYPDVYELQAYSQLCEVTVEGCRTPGRYGSNCSLQCPLNCQNQRCDIVNGSCLGCRPGWTGTFCNQPCEVGFYGLECSGTCSRHCLDNTTCSYVNGNCEKGCVEGFGGMKCEEECENGNYGKNCALNCSGNCLRNLTCNRFSGKCEEGCTPGHTGVRCDEVCPFGFFGQNCSEKCSFTCKSACNHVTGNCNAGCKAGYHGEKCDKLCRFGRYGNNCSKDCSLNCVNQSCDHEMGACKYGCIPGWENPKCSEECSPMTFGPKCKYKCSGHCAGSDTCNHVTGICAKGCADGYNGSFCDLKCVEGYFGTNCLRRCSENCTNTCNHVSGICYCSPGFSNDPYCKELLRGEQNGETNSKTVALIFSVGFNFLLLCSVVFLIRTIQIKRKTESRTTKQNMEPLSTENSMDVHYQDLETVDRSFCYEELH